MLLHRCAQKRQTDLFRIVEVKINPRVALGLMPAPHKGTLELIAHPQVLPPDVRLHIVLTVRLPRTHAALVQPHVLLGSQAPKVRVFFVDEAVPLIIILSPFAWPLAHLEHVQLESTVWSEPLGVEKVAI